MAKKLLLIDPVLETSLCFDSVRLLSVLSVPRISLSYIAALTPSDWDIKIISGHIETVTLEDADLVGITAVTSPAPRAYEISEQYRRKGIKTVMGGIHASMLPDEAIQFVDSVVIGEAESVWQNLIHDFENNELKRFYQGERTSLENLVKPRRDLYNSYKYKVIDYVQTARGCPMDCEFCSVPTLHGRTYRQRPVEEVLDELEALNAKNVLFLDDNIFGYGEKAEERAIQLFRRMKERGLNKRWFSNVGIDFADNPEVLKYAREAGCFMILIGFEALNEETLQGMHKVRNLKVGVRNYKEVIKKIRDHGITVVGTFVFGNDEDSKDVFQRTTEFILDSKIDIAECTISTPFPGTRLYNRLKQEGRLLLTNYPDDWRHYNLFEPVFMPKHMTPYELMEGVNQIYKHTTSRVTSLKRAFNSAIQTRNLYAGVIACLGNRAIGSVWLQNYEYMKNSLTSVISDSCLYYSVTDGESCEELRTPSAKVEQVIEPVSLEPVRGDRDSLE